MILGCWYCQETNLTAKSYLRITDLIFQDGGPLRMKIFPSSVTCLPQGPRAHGFQRSSINPPTNVSWLFDKTAVFVYISHKYWNMFLTKTEPTKHFELSGWSLGSMMMSWCRQPPFFAHSRTRLDTVAGMFCHGLMTWCLDHKRYPQNIQKISIYVPGSGSPPHPPCHGHGHNPSTPLPPVEWVGPGKGWGPSNSNQQECNW